MMVDVNADRALLDFAKWYVMHLLVLIHPCWKEEKL